MTAAYQIPSYNIDEAPALGLYMPTEGTLAEQMDAALSLLKETGSAPIPNLPGFIMRGTILGGGIEFTTIKTWKDADGASREMQISTTHFAPEAADAAIVVQAALSRVPSAAVDPHPVWTKAMTFTPEAPFTIVMPHMELLHGVHEGEITLDEVAQCTGFTQFLIGHAIGIANVAPLLGEDELDLPDEEEQLSAQDVAIAIQTGGVRGNVLIVEPGEDVEPRVYAYIGDAELDAVRVDFNADETVTIDSDGLQYMTLDTEALELLADLRDEAAVIWEEAFDLLDDLDERLIEAEENGEEIEVVDPLTHLYTNHPTIVIDDATSESLQKHLGIAQRYNIEG